ncbi:ATP-binding protein [Streptomyces sp. Tue6028]|uniref:ATP-binding protein n=1 Tax=Streptomyces sp. Tue6028 TaxID=2036037 RepID=UPI003D73DA8C
MINIQDECSRNRFASATVSSADTASARELRKWLTETLTAWGEREVTDVVVLLAAELLSNAVQHARQPYEGGAQVTLTAYCMHDCLCVEVADPDPNPPVLRRARTDDESGRGLALIDAIADRWGVTERSDGKAVWFSCTLPDCGSAATSAA